MQKQVQKQKTSASLVRMKVKTKNKNKLKYLNVKSNHTGHQTKHIKAATPQQYRHIHTLHATTDHSPPHQEFKILLTPGVLKRNRLHLIGCAEAVWL